MKNLLLTSLFSGCLLSAFAQPANDNCASATTLSVNGSCVNGTTLNATVQSGEPCQNGGGTTDQTVWYRFTASQASMVLDFIKTNVTNGPTQLSVYGPNPPCVPTTANAIVNCQILNGDPGVYQSLTGLTIGATYYVQIDGNAQGGPNNQNANFCIGIYTPAANNTISGSSIIDQCGTVFNGSTAGGYYPSGTSNGFNNFDGNTATTVTGASETGDDVTFIINNDSWFKFCATTAGQWQVSFTVGTCILPAPNTGAQMAIFTGTPSALTNIGQAPNPTVTGSTWTSPVINLAAGACAYMVVDGFAGDACNYSYTLTNITGGCNLIPLPVGLLYFNGEYINNHNYLKWITSSELNNSHFVVETSQDNQFWKEVGRLEGSGTTQIEKTYQFFTRDFSNSINYYRLKQVDFNGDYQYSNIISIDNTIQSKEIVKVINLYGQEVDFDQPGVKIIHFSDGHTEKIYK